MQIKYFFILLVHLLFQHANAQQQKDNIKRDSSYIICHVEMEAAFPAGEQAWKRYLDTAFNKIDFGSYFPNPVQDSTLNFKITFTISLTGSIIQIDNKNEEKIPPLLLTEIKKIFAQSPRWRPAVQNGLLVKSHRLQSFTIILPHNED